MDLTYKDLIEIDEDCTKIRMGRGFSLWAAEGKINAFYQEHGMRLTTAKEGMGKLQDEWCQMEQGPHGIQVKTGKIMYAGKEVLGPLIKEGKTIEDYQKAIAQWLATPISERLKIYRN